MPVTIILYSVAVHDACVGNVCVCVSLGTLKSFYSSSLNYIPILVHVHCVCKPPWLIEANNLIL